MIKTLTIPLVLALALLAGCGSQAKQQPAERIVETQDTATGIFTLRELHVADSIMLADKTYKYQFDFTPCDSLRPVRNQQGDDYYDNMVTLKVTQDGRTVTERTFTKQSFSELVPHDFMQYSALVGFTYDYTKMDASDALYFIATVGDPDETADMAFPIELRITPSGSLTLEKAVDLDTEPISPNLNIDPSTDSDI
jgi:hypothetical protein